MFKSLAGQIEYNVSTACYRCGITSQDAALPGRNDAKMGPANSLHASAY